MKPIITSPILERMKAKEARKAVTSKTKRGVAARSVDLHRVARRLDRKHYRLEDALNEIAFAEAILDGMGATEGMTLWGRIASTKDKSPSDPLQRAGGENISTTPDPK